MSIKTAALGEKLKHIDLLPPLIVDEKTGLQDALEKMRLADRGAVIVSKDGKVAGIFTERDLLNKHALEKTAPTTPLARLMTKNPITVKNDTSLGSAIDLMYKNGIRNLPLVDDAGKPIGILTVGRVMRYLADHYPADVVNLPPHPLQLPDQPEGA